MATGKPNQSVLREMELRVLGNVWAFASGSGPDVTEDVFKTVLGVGVRALADNDMSFSDVGSGGNKQKWAELIRPIQECTQDTDIRKHLLLQLLNLISLHPCFNPTE